VILLILVVGLLMWTGTTLLLDAWWRWKRPDLADRLRPFRPTTIADEAQHWLDRQR
jgi:hypothetical protein